MKFSIGVNSNANLLGMLTTVFHSHFDSQNTDKMDPINSECLGGTHIGPPQEKHLLSILLFLVNSIITHRKSYPMCHSVIDLDNKKCYLFV